MSVLLVVGDDYWGARANLAARGIGGVHVAVDRSSNALRALKLIWRGSIPLRAAIAMAHAQTTWPKDRPQVEHRVENNPQLRALCQKLDVSRVLLFRAGLIVSGKSIESTEIFNIHCADVPEFGGLASIWRALRADRFHQHACLHKVTTRIDEGQVMSRQAYEMLAENSYAENERLAYEAGLTLLSQSLHSINRSTTQTIATSG